MAYSATGTAGNDTLNQGGDTGPGTIVGLAGDDCIFTGTGLVSVTGDSGNDLVILQAGNTGTVSGGTENDLIAIPAGTGSMVVFGNEGADNISGGFATAAQTIVGGNNSADGPDNILSGTGADLVFGNGGDDAIRDDRGNNTVVGGFGNDCLWTSSSGSGNDLIFGNQGNDTVFDQQGGSDTIFGGLGNDSVVLQGTGAAQVFGNEGADTVDAGLRSSSVTIAGGNDSADGNDSIIASNAADFVFGNGGNDSINGLGGADTVVGGFGNDLVTSGVAGVLVFANEGNDTVDGGNTGNDTVFGGLGNDTIRGLNGRDTLQGNEGNDTIRGGAAIDTITGGTGNDVFAYTDGTEDGNNAAGGGPVEQITDLDWSVDRFRTDALTVTFAANMGAGTGADLNASAVNALSAAFALGGSGGTQVTAAQFTFGGRTYVVVEQTAAGTAAFDDATDLLIDITGVTGTIATAYFF
jgi:Ca2+-binding RTX toxin-like protein